MRKIDRNYFLLNKQLKKTNSKFTKNFIVYLKNNKKKIIIYENNNKYSSEDLIKKINAILNKLYFNKNKIIILNSRNTTNWVLVYIAAKLMNKIVFIISENLNKELIEKIYKNFDIGGIFQNDILTINNNKNSSCNPVFKSEIGYDCIFTSGSSGNPKIVCIEENSYIFTAKILIKKSKQVKSDIELLSMPFSHSFGLARLRVSILNNQSFFISDGLKNFPKIYEMFFKYRINGLSLVPSAIEIVKFMLKNNAKKFGSKVKYFEIGSDSLSTNSRRWLKENFLGTNIFHHYGSTEASRSFFINRGNKDNMLVSSNCVGQRANGINFKIKKLKNKKNQDAGEILITGPNLAIGYFSINEKVNFIKIKKWFATKDMGFVKNKNLVLVGRLNSMINVGGQKIYPEELEKKVNKLDFVKDSICSSIPDRVLKEVPVLIVKKKNLKFSDKIIIRKISEFFKDFPLYKRPKKIICINKLPLTRNGKKIRNKKILEKYFYN